MKVFTLRLGAPARTPTGVFGMLNDQDELAPLDDSLSPQLFGFPSSPTLQQREAWDNQQRFLRRYAQRGKKSLSAADCGLHVSAVERWQSVDLYGFNKRLEYAYQAYRELCEEENEEWVRESNHNTQIYRIFHMKAIWREKYGDQVAVVGAEVPLNLWNQLRELAGKRIQEQQNDAIDAEVRELGESDEVA